MQTDQIRKGRLEGDRSFAVSSYLSSRDADRKLAEADIRVDMAHILMLEKQGLLDRSTAITLLKSLTKYLALGLPEEVFDESHEDIHAGIEAQLIAEVGAEIGGRMHVGRSRNDEVATCLRMKTREDILNIVSSISSLRRALIDQALLHDKTIMPGFTHFQHAQPTTLAHYLLAYENIFARDSARLFDAYMRTNVCPLGSAAFAGTGFPIDRNLTAEYLGFLRPMENSMDGVASRDFALETMAAISILMINISRLCEELILWSSAFIGFVELDDVYCSTSSIMPQKKNPDTAEIMRGKSGYAVGELMAALTLMKGLPMSYNRDMQDLTPHLWRSLETAEISLPLLSDMIKTANFNTKRMSDEAGRGNSTATELADMMVREFEMPFRTAHNIVGRAVKLGSLDLATIEVAGKEICNCSLIEKGLTQEKIDETLSPLGMVNAKKSLGSPNPKMVKSAIHSAAEKLSSDEAATFELLQHLSFADEKIRTDTRRLIA